jgi:RNA polymerase sigma factor (sigma-70 family)
MTFPPKSNPSENYFFKIIKILWLVLWGFTNFMFSLPNKTDLVDWITFIKTDEDRALKEIYANCREDILRWLTRDFNCDAEEALDIFQAAVVILYDNVMTGKLRELNTHINGYLRAVAKNKAMELLRDKNRNQKKEGAYVWIKYVQQELCSEEDESRIEILTEVLTTLGDPCNKILTSFYYQNRSMEEITAEMGYKNADTTKNQKYKCLKRLQNLYFGHIYKKDLG